MISILFLAADPTDASRLRLGEEAREIQEKLQLSKGRENFSLHQRLSVRPADISQALLDLSPQIVHFSGHGTSAGALCLESKTGEILPVSPEALAALFEQFASQINCVILNACYSKVQAEAIAKHIKYVIGMSQAIDDKAAVAFSTGFYQAMGAGKTIEEAYKLGCVQIRLENLPEHLTPVLVQNKGYQDTIQDPRKAAEDLNPAEKRKGKTGIQMTCLKPWFGLIPGYAIVCGFVSPVEKVQIELKLGETQFIGLQHSTQYKLTVRLTLGRIPGSSRNTTSAGFTLEKGEIIHFIYELPSSSMKPAKLRIADQER